MTSRQGVRLASRVLTVYFLSCAFFQALALPQEISMFLRMREAMGESFFPLPASSRQLVEVLARMVLSLTLNLLFGAVFYRCDPIVARFLLGNGEEEAPAAEGTA